MPDHTIHRFARCELDEGRRQLRRGGELVRVGPRVFDLLVHLVRQSHRVVPHAELRATVWNKRRVSTEAIHACVSRARAAIGDGDDSMPLIRTFARYGYRLVADVESAVRSIATPSPAPVAVRRSRAAAPPASPPAGMFGRQGAMRTVTGALEAAVAGRGALVVVRGEYGMGKTRLAQEVARVAATWGFEVLLGECLELDVATPFWPWAQILRRYAARRNGDAIAAALGSAAADVARIAPALRDRCPSLPDLAPAEDELAPLRVHAGLLELVRRAAAQQPLLVVLDDLQWADVASLRVLTELAPVMPQMRAVGLALWEPRGDGGASERWLPCGSAAASECIGIDLEPLPPAALRATISDVLAQPVPAGFARALAELAAGNPLVVRDTLRHLTAAKMLPPARDRWPSARAVADAGVAPATCAMVEHRLERLGAGGRRVLALAALAGDEFAFARVDRVAAAAGDAALSAIEQAARGGVLQAVDDRGERYRFAAPYLTAAIRQGLNPTRRAHFQAQLAADPRSLR